MRLVILLLTGLIFTSNAIGQEQYMYATEEVAKAELKSFQKNLKASTINRAYRGFFDVTKQKIDVEVTPGIQYIKGLVETTFDITQGGFSEIELNCSDSLSVNSVELNGAAVDFSHANDYLVIKSSNAYKAGSTNTVKISYEGKPRQTRAFVADTNIYGDSVLWTLSQPYGAKEWWPCKQDLQDKIESLEISVTVPSKYKAAANGVLTSSLNLGNGKTKYTFKHGYPIVAYLVAFAVADYIFTKETLDLESGTLDFVNYIFPQDSAEAMEDLKNFKSMMVLFEDLFGPYPFSKELYGHAQFGWGGGMEHQTMSFMVHFKHGLVAHELAHQWFGDKVTCGTWQDLWLNESFATYLEGLTYEFLFDENTWENWKTVTINASTNEPTGSVFIPDTSDVGRMFSSNLTYRKGSYVLHMLRYRMGDEPFFNALKAYLKDISLSYGFAKTDDLIRHMKMQGGEDLDEFFNDWFYKKGFPIYQLEWHQTQQGKLHLVLEQDQSHIWEGTFYEMKVPIRIIDDFSDTIVYIDNYTSPQELILDWPADQDIRVVQLDPDRQILKGESTVFKSDFEQENVIYKISPNPVSDVLNLQLSNAMLPDLTLDIFDLMGNLVISQKVETGISQKVYTMDVSFLNNGAYTIRIKDYWGLHSLKFIKARKL